MISIPQPYIAERLAEQRRQELLLAARGPRRRTPRSYRLPTLLAAMTLTTLTVAPGLATAGSVPGRLVLSTASVTISALPTGELITRTNPMTGNVTGSAYVGPSAGGIPTLSDVRSYGLAKP